MEQNYTPVKPPHPHGTPFLRVVALLVFALLIAVLSSAGTYWFLNRQQSNMSETVPPPGPVYYTSPTPAEDETADWISLGLISGYSIKYPKETFFRTICPEEDLNLSKRTSQTEDEETVETCGRDSFFDIQMTTYNEKKDREFLRNDPAYDVQVEEIEVDSAPAKKYTVDVTDKCIGQCFPWHTAVYIYKNGKTYEAIVSKKEYLDIFNRMLSTFKFTQ